MGDFGQSIMNASAAIPYVRNNIVANHTLSLNVAWEMGKCLQIALAWMNVDIKTPKAKPPKYGRVVIALDETVGTL